MGENERKRIVIGLSGGVDSSAAAALLLREGYEVVGITLKLWPQDCLSRAEDKCCGPQAVTDARSVAHKLGIPFYVMDESDDFQKLVIQYFAEEYRSGRTPNPCVICNERLKFGNLIQKARKLGADLIATGHYARVEQDHVSGRHLLKRAHDTHKDQSYFLFSLRQDQLARARFPLGTYTKPQTRELARENALKTADKDDSVEICFVPDKDYGQFLVKSGLAKPHKGEIVDRCGQVLGQHEGIAFYTIGQRKGLGIAAGKPLYVVDLEPATNRVVVGEAAELLRSEFFVERCNWIAFEHPPAELRASVKIRYHHPGAAATILTRPGGEAKITMDEPQRAVTPGQACVFYQDDLVLGGGWISRKV